MKMTENNFKNDFSTISIKINGERILLTKLLY